MGLDALEIGVGSDLSLDLRYFASKVVMQARDGPMSDVDACIRRLEEERGKIEMFRRELPLCARLLAEGEQIFFPLVVSPPVIFVSECHPFFFGGWWFYLRSDAVACVHAVIDAMKAEAGKEATSDRKVAAAVAEEDSTAGDKSKWMSTAQLWTGDSGREEEDAESEV